MKHQLYLKEPQGYVDNLSVMWRDWVVAPRVRQVNRMKDVLETRVRIPLLPSQWNLYAMEAESLNMCRWSISAHTISLPIIMSWRSLSGSVKYTQPDRSSPHKISELPIWSYKEWFLFYSLLLSYTRPKFVFFLLSGCQRICGANPGAWQVLFIAPEPPAVQTASYGWWSGQVSLGYKGSIFSSALFSLWKLLIYNGI